MRTLPALLLALALAGAVQAEAPSEALRPEGRAAPEPPGRPAARPAPAGALAPLVVEVGPVGAMPPEASGPVGPAALEAPQRPARDDSPAPARLAPLLRPEPAVRLTGRRALVMAEMLMTEPPRPPVIVGGWAGETPPLRPSGAERRPDGAEGEAAPARPRLRPRTPDDPAPPPPPEPDAPPAYRPGARPELRPEAPEYSPLAVASAVSPRRRPEGIVARAEQARAALVRGQVCGDPRLQGEVVAAIRGSGGCGIEEPVRLRSVDGVRLSQPALVDCPTATALLDWIGKGVRPALDGRGGGPVALEIMGHYVCRPRNNQAGQRLSEHGRGRAIDIGAVILADGTRLSVLRDGRDPVMRAMHRAACGIFSTTLGPGSDGFHEDHFHYDTARGRRPYCR